MSDNNRSDDRSEELERINAQLDAQRKEIEALREDAKSEARKWSDCNPPVKAALRGR
jgi:hypothetical protein